MGLDVIDGAVQCMGRARSFRRVDRRIFEF